MHDPIGGLLLSVRVLVKLTVYTAKWVPLRNRVVSIVRLGLWNPWSNEIPSIPSDEPLPQPLVFGFGAGLVEKEIVKFPDTFVGLGRVGTTLLTVTPRLLTVKFLSADDERRLPLAS